MWRGFLPAAVHLLCVDQIMIADFRCRFPYCINPLHPFHLVGCFERFRDTFIFGKFFYQPKGHILCPLIQLGKVAVEFPTEKQTVIQSFAVITDIPKMPPSSHTDRPLFFLWDHQTRNVIIASQLVPKIVVIVINALVHIQNPPYN